MISLTHPDHQNNLQATASQPPLEYIPVFSHADTAQDAAIRLFILGLNVLPVPYGQKGGWPWKQFQYTRLHLDHLQRLFEGPCNIAVMTGRTSENLFVIDCETNDAFQQQGEHLRHAGIPIWSVHSGGASKGGHYYLRCAEGEVANIRLGEIDKDVEVRGNRCYVLAPPSIHPKTHRPYEWGERECRKPPLVHIEDISWLPLRLTTRAKKAAVVPSTPFPGLSRRTQDFIENGAPEGERNNRLFAAACDMIGSNYDDNTIHDILSHAASNAGLPAHEIQNTLRSAFSQPREPSRKSQPKGIPSKPWERALAWAELQVWTGRTGQTDRAVFLACCERARVASYENNTFRASVREVAELARVNKETASRALKRLQKAEYLQFKGRDIISKATLWTLGPITTDKERDPYTIPPWLIKSSVRITHSDAAEFGALGKTASLVYEALCAFGQPIMPKALAARCGLSRDQVQRALRKLAGYNMVCREAVGWVALEVDIEQVAAQAGTLGKGEARKVKHAEQRAKRAGGEILSKQWFERHRRPEVVVEQGEVVPGFQPYQGIQYCQNCGQGILVFEEIQPPPVCGFCAEKDHQKEPTVWLLEPP